MRTRLFVAILISLTLSAPLFAGTWDGTVKLGGVYVDEEGDQSTVQETYNIYDGFSVSQLRLTGRPGNDHYLMFDLRDINHDSRRGDFLFRRPGTFKLNASYDQHRQIFDPERLINSERKDWKVGARVTPAKWLELTGAVNTMTRTGDRASYPMGTTGVLGDGYDYTLVTGQVAAQARKNGRGFAFDWRTSDFSDDNNPTADRTGNVVSGRLWAPYKKTTHLFRSSYGKSELANGNLDYTLSTFQYTGVIRPVHTFQFKYNFDAQRVDDASTEFKTDRIENNFDATYYLSNGSLTAGYGYEMNDDDHRLTAYHTWRVGASVHDKYVRAKGFYAGRVKKDTEELTLLKDVEASRFRGDVDVMPTEDLTLSAGVNVRQREFPDIAVKSDGQAIRSAARYALAGWGALAGAYTYSDDRYTDLSGGFHTISHVVTGRVDFERIKDLRLSTGISYLDAEKDLDIEKSTLFFEGMYTVKKNIHLEAKYNVYNYDDFILLDRYYTANVVWFNVAYDLHFE